jgi:hypothetical protein
MSLVRLLAEGAGEAVKLVPLVFTLGFAPAQAHAQLPRLAAVENARPGPAPVLQAVEGSPAPTLISQHVAIALAEQGSQLRTTSVFRNDTSAPIAAHYTLPLAGAVSLHGIDEDDDPAGDDHACGGPDDADDGDESADAAQFIEAGEPSPNKIQSGLVWLEPGDEITLVSVRPADVLRRDSRRRVVIALPPPPAGQPTPQFSAEIAVDANQPIVALGSATHGGDVDGLGGSHARLFVPNGKVYEARFLSVDLELGTVTREEPRHWGNEDRLPIALR